MIEIVNQIEADGVVIEPASFKINEKIVARLPNIVGTLGMIIMIGMSFAGYSYETVRHTTSVMAILIGAGVTILFIVAELYPYENGIPQHHHLIVCTVPISISYMIIAAIMYSWFHGGGIYEYYMIWLQLHSYIMLFASLIPMIIGMT